jgi:hypothetical protein
MIQQVEQLSPALQKCDNSWVAEQIVAHKIKNKRDNIIKKLPDRPTGQGRPRPSASSSFNSTSTVPMDDNDSNNIDDGPQCAEPQDDVASETSFQTGTVDTTAAAARRDELKLIQSASRRGRGGARGGRGRGARQQPATKTQSLSPTQSFMNEVPVPME